MTLFKESSSGRERERDVKYDSKLDLSPYVMAPLAEGTPISVNSE